VKQVLLICLTLCLSGCVHLEEYFQIHRDGSAKVVFTYSIAQKGLPLLKDCDAVLQELSGKKTKSDLPRLFDAEKLRAHFKSIKGVEVISLRVNRDDGRVETYMHLQIADLRAALRKGVFPYTSLEKEGANYVFSARYPFDMNKIKHSPKLLEIVKSIKVNFKVKTPTLITKSNAPKTLANLAIWEFSPDNTPFTKAGGKYSVHFDAKKLTFLDEKK